jgi:hypothetical protein
VQPNRDDWEVVINGSLEHVSHLRVELKFFNL